MVNNLIYNEENLFCDLEYSVNCTLINSALTLESAIVEYTESYDNYHFITEKTKKTFWQHIKDFFATLIVTFNKFKSDMSIRIDSALKDARLEYKLRNLEEDLKNSKRLGADKVTTVDMIKYKKKYLEMFNKLCKYTKKFEYVNYKSVQQIDKDIDEFCRIYDEYDKELDEIMNTKIEMDINECLKFVSDEIDKKSDVFLTINDLNAKLKELKTSAQAMEDKRNILGEDVLTKRVTFLKKISIKLGKFVRKHVSKFIATIVFKFA